MGKRIVSRFLGILLILASFAVTISVTLHLLGISRLPEVVLFPGDFLYQRFLFAAYYIGVFLLALGYLALSQEFQSRSVRFLIFTLVPFLTAAVLFHVVMTGRPNSVINFFIIGFGGRRPAALVLLLLLLVELLLSYRFTLLKPEAEPSRSKAPRRRVPAHTEEEDDGLFPLREHEDLGVIEELPSLQEAGPEQDEYAATQGSKSETSLQLDRDDEGRLRFSPLAEDEKPEDATEDLEEAAAGEEAVSDTEADVKEEAAELRYENRLTTGSNAAVPAAEEEIFEEEPEELAFFDDDERFFPEETPHEEPVPAKSAAAAVATGRNESADDSELREIVPEGSPGSLDKLYVNDREDPAIRGLVRDLLEAEVEAPVSFMPSTDEEPEEQEESAVAGSEEDEEPEELDSADTDGELPDELDLEEIELAEEDLDGIDAVEEVRILGTGVYEEEIEEDQLAMLEEKYGDDREQDEFDDDPLPLSPDENQPVASRLETDDPGDHGKTEIESKDTKKKSHTAESNPVKKKKTPYSVPVDDLLEHYNDHAYWVVDEETRHSGEILRKTLEEFKIEAEVTGIRKGPVITMFEILPAPGVKLSKITNLADNIALRLAASSVRIVAPIPGKHAVGIEVPNHKRAIVSFHEMISDEKFEKKHFEIPVILGKDIAGGSQLVDLVNTPHLLIAGATGSGKSVCVNSLICSLLCRKTPDDVRLLLIDPKIVELKLYNDIPHLMTPVITEPKRAFQALQYCLSEMEQRYALLDSQGVRDIRSYNRKVKERRLATRPLPYIVIIVDEFADLMASTGKELESTLARLAAMSRAVGIHLVLATQRPSIDVITGLIKANIPSRIAFMVAGKTDSRIIIDTVGAEKLLGKGDMLFTSAWDPNPTRIQGAFLSEEEVGNIVSHVKTLGEPDYIDDEIFFDDDDESSGLFDEGGDDPLMNKALEIVTQAGKASASYLQRRLKIGYNRAARLVEDMERRGIVGPQNGSKPREILHIPDRVEQTVEG